MAPLGVFGFDGAPGIPVLVLRLEGTRYPYVCAAIARTLGRSGIDVYLAHTGKPRSDSRSRWFRRGFQIAHDDQLNALLLLASRLTSGSRPVLVAVDDTAAFFVDEHVEQLSATYQFPRQPAGLIRDLSNKARLHAVCRDLDLPTPATTKVESAAMLMKTAPSLNFPVALKIADGRLRRTLSVAIADSPEALMRHAAKMQAGPAATNLVVQEYIPGGPDTVWMFNGYFAADSTPTFGITARKLRQYPPYSGVTALGVCEANERVMELTARLAKETGYRGVIDIGFRYDARDDEFKILDVNPRVGASFRLFVDDLGHDVVRAMYADLVGRDFKSGSSIPGRKWIVENYDLRSSITYFARGELTVGRWIGSLRGVEEAAWFARDDVAPFAGMVIDSLADLSRLAVSRALRPAGALLRRLGYRRAKTHRASPSG
jgi:D-aspartate ligase